MTSLHSKRVRGAAAPRRGLVQLGLSLASIERLVGRAGPYTVIAP
jgi:hypothetical protein